MYTTIQSGRTRQNRRLAGRRLVLVDIENIVGGAVLTTEDALAARHRLEATGCIASEDQVVIGVSHIGLLNSGLAWVGARMCCRSGPDGADLVLLDVVRHENVAERFDEVVLASGDGIFADMVAKLAGAGVRTTVIAPAGHCSRRLQMACDEIRFLVQEENTFEEAA